MLTCVKTKKFLLLAGQDFSSSPLFGPVICDDGDGDTHCERFPSDRSTGEGEKGGSGRRREKQIVVAGSGRNVVVELLLLLSRGASDYTRSSPSCCSRAEVAPPCSGRRTKFFLACRADASPRPEGGGRGGEKRGGNFLSGRCVFS